MNIKIEPGANVQITDKPIYNIYGDVVQEKVVQVEDSTNKEKNIPHFPLYKTKDEGVFLYNFLSENNYIKVQLDSWLFLMGCVTEKPQKVESIMWLTTKEQLRTMLVKFFEGLITNNALKKADLERLVPKCFVDTSGKPLNLPKTKTEYSEKMDQLEKFFRPSSDV